MPQLLLGTKFIADSLTDHLPSADWQWFENRSHPLPGGFFYWPILSGVNRFLICAFVDVDELCGSYVYRLEQFTDA
jgi:hypothetical protein